MAALILFALLFLCGLLNSIFFPSSKLLPWLRSLLLLSSISPPKSKPKPPNPDLKNEHQDSRSESLPDSSDLRTLFATFDSNSDGFISAAELSHSLRRLGLHTTGDDLTNMMERMDSNGDGLIDLNEFGELCNSLRSEPAAEEEDDGELRKAFDVFDGNGNGLITAEELSLVLKSLGLQEGHRADACRDMISKIDLDGDGMVNFDEFKKMMAGNVGGLLF
ncbi:calmodulin-like protein 7 [Phalaenopsis equestris]|uniref:calmodulin-like protein 7 n=1 Tax=Phalaenopsis equestris TaxID=78828 RepID=UPI0009E2D317|nr:calmodulin-like protein 7 [Phalaenopsis equestris]